MDPLGDVYKIGDIYLVMYPSTEPRNQVDIDYTVKMDDNVDVTTDYPLQKLSSQPYIVTFGKDMAYEKLMYETDTDIPIQCQYKAMLVIRDDQVVDYSPRSNADDMFITAGYAEELKNAKHIFIPNTPYEPLSDLLIQSRNGDVYTSFNGRKMISTGTPSLYMNVVPIFSGEENALPYTYTIESLVEKTKVLNSRLHIYGKKKVESMVRSLQCVIDRISKDDDPFLASLNYDRVSTLVQRLI